MKDPDKTPEKVQSASTSRDEMRDYLADNQALQEHYPKLKNGFQDELRGLYAMTENAKGTETENYLRQLLRDFTDDFDLNILNLFKAINLKDNQYVQTRFLQNVKFPNLVFSGTKVDGRTIPTLPDHVAARTWDKNTIIINQKFHSNGGYLEFKATFVHELIHALVESHTRKSWAFRDACEGIAEILASESIKYETSTEEDFYPLNKLVANRLCLINKYAMMGWYTGAISDQEYEKFLSDKIGPENAKLLFIKDGIIKKRDEESSKIANDLRPFLGSEKEKELSDMLSDFMYGHKSLKEFRNFIDQVKTPGQEEQWNKLFEGERKIKENANQKIEESYNQFISAVDSYLQQEKK